MATSRIPSDFKEFLKLLSDRNVDYLLIGGYAVNYYGYVRPTGDMDIFIAARQMNAEKLVAALADFGFIGSELTPKLFLKETCIVRMGVPPLRLEILTSIDGVTFDECFNEREAVLLDEIPINVISLKHLKINKRASGRYKDLADLENLP